MSAPLSSDPKRRIDPWKAVKAELLFSGEAGSVDLPRLADALKVTGAGADWPVRYSLRFGRDASEKAVVVGQVSLTVRPICQRCLSQVVLSLECDISVALISDEAQAEDLPDHLDPVLVEDGAMRPLDLVEDELLLALPQVPMHLEGECADLYQLDPVPEETVTEQENPFAVLASLKRPGSGSKQ